MSKGRRTGAKAGRESATESVGQLNVHRKGPEGVESEREGLREGGGQTRPPHSTTGRGREGRGAGGLKGWRFSCGPRLARHVQVKVQRLLSGENGLSGAYSHEPDHGALGGVMALPRHRRRI